MNNKERNEVLIDAYNLSNTIVSHLDSSIHASSSERKAYVEKAESLKDELKSLAQSLDTMQDHIGVNLSTKTVNAQMLYAASKVRLLDSSVDQLMGAFKNGDTNAIPAFKHSIQIHSDKSQVLVGQITEDNFHESFKLLTVSDDGVSTIESMINMVSPAYQSLLDDHNNFDMKSLLDLKSEDRMELFRVYIIAKWLSTIKENSAPEMKVFKRVLDAGKEINNLYRLCFPYEEDGLDKFSIFE